MNPITKEQYQFIETNFVGSKEYDLDFEGINRIILFEKKIKKIGFVIDNEFTQAIFAYLCIFLFFVIPMSTLYLINQFVERMNYEINFIFFSLIAFTIWFLNVRFYITIFEKYTFERTARNFALFILSFFNSSKYKYHKKHEKLFNDYVNELKLKVSDKIDNQNNLINGLRWLYDKSIPFMRESLLVIKRFETDFNSIKEINKALKLGLSDIEKSSFNSKVKNSDWWKMEENIQETKTRLEEEIYNKELREAIKREKELEEQIKRDIRLAEYEKKRKEQELINEAERLVRIKEAEEVRKEKERLYKIQQAEKMRKQAELREILREQERLQKFLNRKTTPNRSVKKNKPRAKKSKIISPEKLSQILSQKTELGRIGEKLILEELRDRLKGTIYQPFSDKFIHVAEQHGDGAGYDILAYNENAEPIYVEVKTTTAKYPAAKFSKNELDFAAQHENNYVLFLVYNLNTTDFTYEYEEIYGFSSIKEQLDFLPTDYKLRLKNNYPTDNLNIN